MIISQPISQSQKKLRRLNPKLRHLKRLKPSQQMLEPFQLLNHRYLMKPGQQVLESMRPVQPILYILIRTLLQ
ncbi:hypothetical protein RhiirA1_424958 [Rhizophagus irregularis]|uniref:Uncharacterized protein n=1 Tax=Rhizophagus irregularis TaxID=588596 RepID=A0A2I1EAV9_9GLOM|nr:hypothetical protein RhiirA1_424958 [Rhizophagus irregularis]PKY19233.1 hypothetical protein RhiirB3_406599 [Rhizophagus irregularis]